MPEVGRHHSVGLSLFQRGRRFPQKRSLRFRIREAWFRATSEVQRKILRLSLHFGNVASPLQPVLPKAADPAFSCGIAGRPGQDCRRHSCTTRVQFSTGCPGGPEPSGKFSEQSERQAAARDVECSADRTSIFQPHHAQKIHTGS